MKRMPLFILVFVIPALIVIFTGCASSRSALSPGKEKSVSVWENSKTVTTVYGVVSGREKGENYVWWGIPYARPPVDELRWRAPRPPVPWEGIFAAVRKPPEAIQYALFPKKAVKGQEDCLYLNIFRSETGQQNLPVYVWIHGGGNSSGSSTYVSDYYGYSFPDSTDAVFVSINYRLGPFGWFTHPSLRAGEDELDSSGNYGLLDILMALRWVQDNITAFGGDPDNVTVAGESAGAINILALLQSPLSEGLFHKGIVRSGGIMQSSVQEGDAESTRILRELLRKEGYEDDEISRLLSEWGPEETAAFLRRAKPEDILRGFDPRSFGLIAFPLHFTDGAVLPREGKAVFEDGSYPVKIPLIIGSNRDEVKLFFSGRKDLRSQRELYQAASRLGSDKWKVEGVDAIVRTLLDHPNQPPVFAYYFTWGTLDEDGNSVLPCNRGEIFGACHALEVPFFHGTVDTTPFGIIFFSCKNREGAEKLSSAIMSYTKEFLWNGDLSPESPDLPTWESWDTRSDAPKYLVLNAGYENLSIGMSEDEFTFDSIYKNLEESYSEDIYKAAVEFIEKNGFNLRSIEKR